VTSNNYSGFNAIDASELKTKIKEWFYRNRKLVEWNLV
jgi:hypothetical protein